MEMEVYHSIYQHKPTNGQTFLGDCTPSTELLPGHTNSSIGSLAQATNRVSPKIEVKVKAGADIIIIL